MRIWSCAFIVMIFIMVMSGCSGGNNAIAPDSNMPGNLDMTNQQERVSSSSGHNVLWGMWDIQIDTVNQTVEIVPLRGVQWTVDVVQFMQPPAGPLNSLSIDIVDVSEWFTLGHLPVNVTLTHPFAGLNQYTGMDVRGVFITTGQNVMNYAPGLTYTDRVNDPYLANADGYTRWMNPVDFPDDHTLFTYTEGILGSGDGFDATLNPYKYFANGIGEEESMYDFFSDPSNLENRGQFIASTTVTRLYDLYFKIDAGTPELRYQYAVVASWTDPDDFDPGDLPGSWAPEANTLEAFLVDVADNSTLYFKDDQAGGDIVLDIEVFDWQPYLSGEGSVIDQIERIVIESPQGIMPTPYAEFDNATLAMTAGPGTTDASSVVSIEITDCVPTDLLGQEVIIGVEHSGGIGYDNDGLGTNFPEAPLTAYFFHTLSVSSIIPQTDLPVITAITPDHGIAGTHIYDVEITGENFTNVNLVRLVGDSEETSVVNLNVIDDNNMMCEIDMDTLSLGLYDVVATDPDLGDGTLEDGFEVMDCPGGIHDSLTFYSTTEEYSPLFVAGVFTSGQYAGQCITQRGATAWNRLEVGDPPQDNTLVTWYANKPSIFPMVNDWSWSLDCDPLNEIFAFTTFDDDDDSGSWPNTQFDFVKICSQDDGSYKGACDTDCGYAVAQVDVDEYGNVWAVCSNAYYPNFGFTLQRWDYDPDEPDPGYVFVNEWDISSVIQSDGVISDIVVLERYRRLYISHSPDPEGPVSWGVSVSSWDISGADPVWLETETYTQTGFYGTNSFQEVHQRFVDMEVDRTDDVLAGCRIAVMFMGKPASNRTLEIRKLDVDLNTVAETSIEFNKTYVDDCFGSTRQMWFSNFILDDENDGRIVAIYDNFCVPPPGYIGVAPAPTDW